MKRSEKGEEASEKDEEEEEDRGRLEMGKVRAKNDDRQTHRQTHRETQTERDRKCFCFRR